jgi:hypothetical protein
MSTGTIERYSTVRGSSIQDAMVNRFGEWCWAEAFAEEYATVVWAQKQQRQIAGSPAPFGRGAGASAAGAPSGRAGGR